MPDIIWRRLIYLIKLLLRGPDLVGGFLRGIAGDITSNDAGIAY